MYGRLTETPRHILDRIRPQRVERREGHYTELLARHEGEARLVRKAGRAGLKKVAPYLFRRITDERALRCAFDYLAEHGGQAPGPDGLRYDDLATERQKWHFCRSLRDDLRAWEYQPGPERVVRVPKGAGRGDRTIVLQNIDDRMVQRSAWTIIQPLLDPYFDDHSFGYRPGRSRLGALSLAEQYLLKDGRDVWLTQDIQNAFQNVSLPRLLQLVEKYLCDRDLTRLVQCIVDGASVPGLRQGGSLSPGLLNLYLHHFLDRPWRKHHPDLPLIRVADDLLVPCRSVQEARRAHDAIAELLAPTGMALRESRAGAVRRLSPQSPAHWLGFLIDQVAGDIRYRIADRAWDRLDEALRLAHEALAPQKRARQVIEGWLVQMAPCWQPETVPQTLHQVKELIRQHGLKMPRTDRLRRLWADAHTYWDSLRWPRLVP